MFVRLFVDENLDRMVPISKQPKEKIQAIIESCGRQFPEFQERSRKRIRTYLKSCRRMKKTACESETRNAAKRMRLDLHQNHDQLYTNGGISYNLRGYSSIGNNLQHPASLTTSVAQSNGPTDLSMKSLASNPGSSSSSSGHGQGGGGGGASAQLSPPEVTAVRQLIAGYRESAAFLLRSADELESLILLQN
ncbi:hypothetical protein JZ751_012950 [Albula glossodonta]|uniref:Nucleolar protein 4 helical domain-containing protein n=1 Tax=Albula glossodonta TaxID=121402 RepID=A0A8T2N1C4_9TELE|nr:hypothetical protein JZ751_012950 [Albula glossodonta]